MLIDCEICVNFAMKDYFHITETACPLSGLILVVYSQKP